MILKALALVGMLAIGAQIALPSACSSQQPAVNTVVGAVQAACAFVPTAASVESILNANPTITQVQDIVDIICNAVGAPPAPAAGAHLGNVGAAVEKTIYVNGKPIVLKGNFVS